jgi:hypothetical protein
MRVANNQQGNAAAMFPALAAVVALVSLLF